MKKIEQEINQLEQFREQVYHSFAYRADALMELMDGLSSHVGAQSVVELSLNPSFRRQYSSVHQAIAHFLGDSGQGPERPTRAEKEQELMGLIAPHLPAPQRRGYWLFAVDVTPAPRPYAERLADRRMSIGRQR